MANIELGIVEADFTDNPLRDFGRTVIRTPRTKTISNMTGSPTYTDATDENITAIFTHRSKNYDWSKDGQFEAGDAFMMVDKDQELNKDDLITVDDLVFTVDTVITRQVGGTLMFKSCNLFLRSE